MRQRDALRRVSSAENLAEARPVMDWDDYFRQQATMYRELAQKTEDSFIKQEGRQTGG